MRVEETELAGVVVVHPRVFKDERGFLLESYRKERYDEFEALRWEFVQDNHSRSHRGVLRGLHYQHRHRQGKLVRVSRGRVFDVAVDIDPASPTFRKHVSVILDDVEHRQLFVPPGYAHGFCVLSEFADTEYRLTANHVPGDGRGVLWNDPALAIPWPIENPLVSAVDRQNPTLEDCLGR